MSPRSLSRFHIQWLVITMSLSLCSSHLVLAQPTIAPTPPLQFDRATVQNLVENIDKPRNASWLKVLYFSRRKSTPTDLPIEEGWKLLSDATDAETTGTRRWFLLQSVKGAVAYRKSAVDGVAGANAYKALFDQAKDAPTVRAEYIVCASINEFLSSLGSVIKDREQLSTRETMGAVTSAWNAFTVSQTYTDKLSRNVTTTDWVATFKDISAPYGLVNILDQQIKDNPHPFYELLSFDAYLHSEIEPKLAIEQMEKAEGILPTWPDGKVKKAEATLYFSRLISYYKAAKQDEQIAPVIIKRDVVLALAK